jgi:hypothetical protein
LPPKKQVEDMSFSGRTLYRFSGASESHEADHRLEEVCVEDVLKLALAEKRGELLPPSLVVILDDMDEAEAQPRGSDRLVVAVQKFDILAPASFATEVEADEFGAAHPEVEG